MTIDSIDFYEVCQKYKQAKKPQDETEAYQELIAYIELYKVESVLDAVKEMLVEQSEYLKKHLEKK
jgi:hypothetical protein